jgi:hypothetical protein
MLDGNAAVNRSTLIAIVTGLIIPPGTTFGIRWADYDPSGPDDGLAVDDFTLTPRGGDDVSGYYRGELRDFKTDDLQVGLSLCVDGTVVRGSYFYLRSGGDIRLRGTRAPDGGVELEETTPPGVVTGRWSGRPAPSVGGGWSDRIAPTLTGTWTAPKGDRHRFTLVKAGAIPADSGASGQAGATERPCSEVGYRMVRLSPRKQDYYPRLVRFRDPDVMATVNAVLEYQGRSFHEGLESDLRSSCEKDGDQQVDIGVEYASRDVLSIRVVGEWMCYGPGGVPGQRDDSVTYDLRTGEPITDLTTLFKPGLPWQELFGVLFAYQIAAAASPRGDECLRQYTPQKLGPLGVAFHLTSGGLVVGPSSYGLSSMVGHCEQMTVVPYALLRGLAPPDGVLARVAGPPSPAGPARYLIRDWDDEGVQIVYHPPQPRP